MKLPACAVVVRSHNVVCWCLSEGTEGGLQRRRRSAYCEAETEQLLHSLLLGAWLAAGCSAGHVQGSLLCLQQAPHKSGDHDLVALIAAACVLGHECHGAALLHTMAPPSQRTCCWYRAVHATH
jgi:hypothetical protein